MTILRITAAVVITAVAASLAGIPNQEMSSGSLGVEYAGFLRGQTITAQAVPSHERFQAVYLHYAPVEYVLISVGLGIDRMSVDTYNSMSFTGKYGFAPGARLSLFTPRFINEIFSLTVACDLIYLNTADDHDYSYAGPIVDPYGGLKISVANMVDFQLGARGHFMYGSMTNGRTKAVSNFSNNEIVRGYLSATLHSSAAWLTLHFDASPEIGSDWSAGPVESTIGLTVGVILKPAGSGAKVIDDSSKTYFPSYEELKAKQDRMAKEIQ